MIRRKKKIITEKKWNRNGRKKNNIKPRNNNRPKVNISQSSAGSEIL